MSHEIVTKGVSFNVLDPDQEEMLSHACKRKNFSSYVKRLIQRDIDNAFTPNQYHEDLPEFDNALDENLMEGLI